MKSSIKVISAILLGLQVTMACDVCGCEVGGGGAFAQASEGINLGVKYSYQSFDAEIDYESDYFEDEKSSDAYQNIFLTLSASIWGPIYGVVGIPLKWNTMKGSHVNTELVGIGDVDANVIYEIYRSELDMQSPLSQRLMLSLGMGIPTGEYKATYEGEALNENFQLGSGSFYLTTGIGYVIRGLNYGLTLESIYKSFTENDLNYQKGDQFNTRLKTQYFMQFEKIETFVELGYQYNQNFEDRENGVKHINRGGSTHSLLTGMGIDFKAFKWNSIVEIPLYQNYTLDRYSSLSSTPSFSMSISFGLFSPNQNEMKMEVM